jgi:hypothetical protein
LARDVYFAMPVGFGGKWTYLCEHFWQNHSVLAGNNRFGRFLFLNLSR